MTAIFPARPLITFLALSMASMPAQAAELIKDWSFSGDVGNCSLIANYDDSTTIIIGHMTGSAGDLFFVQAVNPKWRIAEGQVRGSAILDGNTTIMSSIANVKKLSDGTVFHTLAFRPNADLLNRLSNAQRLSLKFNDTNYGGYVLKGLPKPLEQFKKCTGGSKSTTIVQNNPSSNPPPVAEPPAPPSPPGKLTATVTKSMMNDINMLILNDSQGWWRNAYIFNSVYKADVMERIDNKNFTVRAWYLFNRSQKGNVDVVVVNGRYRCLRFWDNRGKCKPARTEQM